MPTKRTTDAPLGSAENPNPNPPDSIPQEALSPNGYWHDEREQPARNVVEALQRVMRDLPAIGKDERASQEQGGYAYRGIEAITKHAQVLLARHRVTFVPRVVSHEVVPVRVGNKDWTDVRLLVEYDVYGPGGLGERVKLTDGTETDLRGDPDRITVGPFLAIGRDGSDKGANKCMTQAFKYALLQVLCISDKSDDADGTTFEADRPDEGLLDLPIASLAFVNKIVDAVKAAREAGVEVDAQGWTVLGTTLVQNRRVIVDQQTAEGVLAQVEALLPASVEPCWVCGEPGVQEVDGAWYCDEHRLPPEDAAVLGAEGSGYDG